MDGIEAIAAAPESTVIESPTPETPESTTPESPTPETPDTPESPTPESGEEEELPGDPGDEEALETDARKLDDKTRKMVADLKKTNPAAAKELANQFFRRLAYEKEFPTVQDARQAKATIESLGGEEGISKLQEEVTDYRSEIEQFANGDPALVEQLYKSNPESTAKMVEAALDIFTQSNNIQALDSVLLRPIAQRLQQVGLHTHLLKAAEFIKNGKGQEAYDTLGAIGEWLTKLTGDAEKMGTTRTAKDPREEQLTQREQKLQEQEARNVERVIHEEVSRLNNRSLSKTIEPFFKELKLNHEGRREFTQNLQSKIWAAMKADEVFVRNANNVKKKGDHAATAKFVNAKFNEVLPAVFRSYRNSLYPNLMKAAAKNGQPTATNGKPAPAKAAPTNSTVIKVADAPKFDEVDWSKDPGDKLWSTGYAYLKNGKFVYFH